jgi:hypothetical protein
MGDTAAASVDGTVSVDTAETMPACEPTPPPANVPDEGTAEAKARELFGSVGIDLGSYELETYADEWGANVTAYLTLDGIRTNVSVSVGFGAEGVVTWASGFLAAPQRGADYPRIGIEAAVQRLNDQSAGWAAYGPYEGRAAVDVAASTEVVPDTATPPDASTTPAQTDVMVDPVEGVCLDDTGTECTPGTIEVEPVTVTLTNARPSLEQLWGTDDTIWLLPGYAFDSADGGIYSVLAVEDQYIEVAQPDVVPVPEPADEPASTASPGVDAPASYDATPLIGLAEDEAAKVAEGLGLTMRVVRIDGVEQPVTADYVDARANVAVEGGTVTEIVSFG